MTYTSGRNQTLKILLGLFHRIVCMESTGPMIRISPTLNFSALHWAQRVEKEYSAWGSRKKGEIPEIQLPRVSEETKVSTAARQSLLGLS